MELKSANDTEIFKLTGCLSKCDKYSYRIYARPVLEPTDCKGLNNTMKVYLGFTSGIHEIREQVVKPK